MLIYVQGCILRITVSFYTIQGRIVSYIFPGNRRRRGAVAIIVVFIFENMCGYSNHYERLLGTIFDHCIFK